MPERALVERSGFAVAIASRGGENEQMSNVAGAPSPRTAGLEAIDHFSASEKEVLPGRQLAAIREAAPSFREWFAGSGSPGWVRTCDLIALPYPRRYALWRAALSPAPYVRIFNRMLAVRWRDADGSARTMLVEPTEHDLAANTPYFAAMEARHPRMRSMAVVVHGTVEGHLERLGIAPEEVDYLTFDHLHTQDLRRWLGTTKPAPDLVAQGKVPEDMAGEPLDPVFPNARLLVMRAEWEQLADGALHPLQRRWYQQRTFGSLRTDRVEVLDGDTLVGPGIALLRTPGHSIGNHSVVLNTSSGIWTSSENGVHAECYSPERSRIPGLRSHAREWGAEVVLNANTPELAAYQVNSMVKEKLVADRGGPGGEWVQHFPSSELTPWVGSPGTSPSFVWSGITHGSLSLA